MTIKHKTKEELARERQRASTSKGRPQTAENGARHSSAGARPPARQQSQARPQQGRAQPPRSNGARPAPAPKVQIVKKLPTEVTVEDFITVRDLATLMERSPIDLIRILMQYGIMAPITHSIDHDTAVILGEELGVKVLQPVRELTAEEVAAEEVKPPAMPRRSKIRDVVSAEKTGDLILRPPVVAVLGHVDHGKTTLLDRLRSADVASGEAGGITQRTGAYQTTLNGRKITFLDTPGHEAFTNMRARGAQVTDIVVLVVAADDGVMPQTKEAISHARAAGVPIVVAINKIDKANANPERVMEELAQEGLQPEQWGGDTIMVPLSALTRLNVESLLENLLVVADLEEYKANPKGKAVGTVIESELDKSRGPTATLLIQNGTLHQGDTIVVGNTWGRLKAIFDYTGKPLKEAGPSTPVIVLGLQELPGAGETFEQASSDREARRMVEERQTATALANRSPERQQLTLEDLFAKLDGGKVKTLNLIVRADMQGTLEPVKKSLEDLSNEQTIIKILQTAIGDITESDVMLAEASNAVIIGFSVGVDKTAAGRAEQSGVEIRHYEIIYKMIEDIELALKGLLDPVYKDVMLGHATVLQLFKLRKGAIAGCQVTDGIVKRTGTVRIQRAGTDLFSGIKVEALRRFTEDASEVRQGFECGIKLVEHDNDLKEGDVLEFYEKQRVR